MSGCGHDHQAHGSHGARRSEPTALQPEVPKDGIAKAAAVPFGVTPIDETQRQERIKRLKGLDPVQDVAWGKGRTSRQGLTVFQSFDGRLQPVNEGGDLMKLGA